MAAEVVHQHQDEFPSAHDLGPLLHPRGIAIVGASADTGKFSGRLVPALTAGRFSGRIYPVNPRHREMAGLPCFSSLAAVPDPCDLVIVAVPASQVPDVLRQAVDRGIAAAVVLSSGFDEIGVEGQARAEEIRALGGRIRIYGPNCPGLWQIRDGVVYTFSSQYRADALRVGSIGLVTQGGALGRAVLDAMDLGVGFSYWFSTGNEADLEVSDFVALLADDPGTDVVASLVEGWRDGRRFLRAAARCRAAGKPLIVAKIGQSAAGARAARGHTAKVNGSGPVAAAALRQAGCLLVDDVDELTDLAALLQRYPQPGSGGLGICTFSGGSGVLIADHATRAGVPLPDLGRETAAELEALLPDIAAIGNPTDLTTAVLQDPALARQALEIMLSDPAFAMVLFSFPHRLDAFDEPMARELAQIQAHGRPLVAVMHSPLQERERATAILREASVPVLPSAHRAAAAVAGWLAHRDNRAFAPYRPASIPRRKVPLSATALDGKGLCRRWGIASANGEETSAGGFPLRCAAFWDAAFGPVIQCGPGGPWALAAFGVVFRLAPTDPSEARAMVEEAPWVASLRSESGPGAPDALADVLVRLGGMLVAERDRLEAVELDPVRLVPGGLRAVACAVRLVPRTPEGG